MGPARGYGYGGVLGGAGANAPPSRQVGVLAAGSGGDSDTAVLSVARESQAFPPDKRAGSPLGPVGGSDTAVARESPVLPPDIWDN